MPTDHWKSLRSDFARKAAWDITKYVLVGGTLAAWAYVTSAQAALRVAALAPFRWPLVITTISSVIIAVGGVYRKRHRFVPLFGPLSFDYIVVKKEVHYKRAADGSVEYRRKLLLRALRSDLDTYTDKYHWTGSGAPLPIACVDGQQAYQTVRKNVWQFYEVRFPKTLKKGEEITTEVLWRLDDAARGAVPFISATIEEPTLHLRLVAQFPPELGIKQATKEMSVGIGAKKPLSSVLEQIDADGRAVYDESHPQLLHHYEIKWWWPKA